MCDKSKAKTLIKPEVLPVRLRRIIAGVMAAGAFYRQLLGREFQKVHRVARHHVLVACVVHDKFLRAETVSELFEEEVVRFAMTLKTTNHRMRTTIPSV